MGDKTEGKVSALILKHARHVVVSSWLAHETGPLFLCRLLGTGRARDRPGATSSAPPCLRWALLKSFFPGHHSEYHPSAPFGPLTTLEPGCHGLLRVRAPRRSSLARGALFPLLTPLKGSLVPFPGVLSAAALFAAHRQSLSPSCACSSGEPRVWVSVEEGPFSPKYSPFLFASGSAQILLSSPPFRVSPGCLNPTRIHSGLCPLEAVSLPTTPSTAPPVRKQIGDRAASSQARPEIIVLPQSEGADLKTLGEQGTPAFSKDASTVLVRQGSVQPRSSWRRGSARLFPSICSLVSPLRFLGKRRAEKSRAFRGSHR